MEAKHTPGPWQRLVRADLEKDLKASAKRSRAAKKAAKARAAIAKAEGR